MKIKSEYHVPALLQETIGLLKIEPGKKYIDATLGGGGHSEEIIKRGGILLGIDCDPQAIEYNKQRLEGACPSSKLQLAWGNFTDIEVIARQNDFEKVAGILFDLGVSSHQLETAERGFSFNLEGKLDMRMDPRLKVTAEDLVNVLNEGELEELFLNYGEEKASKRFARTICASRKIKKIETGNELAEIILKEAPRRGRFDRIHPATRVFQSLRIAVNDELNCLKTALPKALSLLDDQGRLVILSFHSLEDGIVKKIFSEKEKSGLFKVITPKPIVPSREEIKNNPRARSAKLRALEKTQR